MQRKCDTENNIKKTGRKIRERKIQRDRPCWENAKWAKTGEAERVTNSKYRKRREVKRKGGKKKKNVNEVNTG